MFGGIKFSNSLDLQAIWVGFEETSADFFLFLTIFDSDRFLLPATALRIVSRLFEGAHEIIPPCRVLLCMPIQCHNRLSQQIGHDCQDWKFFSYSPRQGLVEDNFFLLGDESYLKIQNQYIEVF